MNANVLPNSLVPQKLKEIDNSLRTGVASKEIAEQMDVTPTGFYSALASMGWKIATIRFLFNPASQKPLLPVRASDIRASILRALSPAGLEGRPLQAGVKEGA